MIESKAYPTLRELSYVWHTRPGDLTHNQIDLIVDAICRRQEIIEKNEPDEVRLLHSAFRQFTKNIGNFDPVLSATPLSQHEIEMRLKALSPEAFLNKISWFVPHRYREGFFGDLIEDASRMRMAGLSETMIKTRLFWQIVLLVVALMRQSAKCLGAWMVTKII